jgi:hypothetical protein
MNNESFTGSAAAWVAVIVIAVVIAAVLSMAGVPIFLSIVLVLFLAAVFIGWLRDRSSAAARLADYEVRRELGELTPSEIAEERAEERASRERRAAGKDLIY